jgi:hypothetical protein
MSKHKKIERHREIERRRRRKKKRLKQRARERFVQQSERGNEKIAVPWDHHGGFHPWGEAPSQTTSTIPLSRSFKASLITLPHYLFDICLFWEEKITSLFFVRHKKEKWAWLLRQKRQKVFEIGRKGPTNPIWRRTWNASRRIWRYWETFPPKMGPSSISGWQRTIFKSTG